jgi:hypothetical protein
MLEDQLTTMTVLTVLLTITTLALQELTFMTPQMDLPIGMMLDTVRQVLLKVVD